MVLYRQRRYSGAVYLMGYALEFAFKRKVSQTLGFNQGFPESKAEFNAYSIPISSFNSISTGVQLTQLKQIKNHNLNELLIFSGAQARITASYYNEWLIVKDWTPEDRYKIRRYNADKAKIFMNAAKIILTQID